MRMRGMVVGWPMQRWHVVEERNMRLHLLRCIQLLDPLIVFFWNPFREGRAGGYIIFACM